MRDAGALEYGLREDCAANVVRIQDRGTVQSVLKARRDIALPPRPTSMHQRLTLMLDSRPMPVWSEALAFSEIQAELYPFAAHVNYVTCSSYFHSVCRIVCFAAAILSFVDQANAVEMLAPSISKCSACSLSSTMVRLPVDPKRISPAVCEVSESSNSVHSRASTAEI